MASRTLRLPCLFIAILMVGEGCRTAHFAVQDAPAQPEHRGSFKVASPELPVVVAIANFDIEQVDTQYPEREKELFRKHFSVAIPNVIQQSLGERQVFAQVVREAHPGTLPSQYEITGSYDFFERLGTQGREWIPFAGTFGAKINEAWIKANLAIRVVDRNTGAVVLSRSYPEEHLERTSIYQQPRVGYLQSDYIARISSEIIDAIRR